METAAELAQEDNQDGPITITFKSWVKNMTKTLSKVESKSEEYFQVETRNLQLEEAMKESELAMWKAKVDKIKELLAVCTKIHEAKWSQWALRTHFLEEEKAEQV